MKTIKLLIAYIKKLLKDKKSRNKPKLDNSDYSLLHLNSTEKSVHN